MVIVLVHVSRPKIVAHTLNDELPALVGFPEMVPFSDMFSPLGSSPVSEIVGVG